MSIKTLSRSEPALEEGHEGGEGKGLACLRREGKDGMARVIPRCYRKDLGVGARELFFASLTLRRFVRSLIST